MKRPVMDRTETIRFGKGPFGPTERVWHMNPAFEIGVWVSAAIMVVILNECGKRNQRAGYHRPPRRPPLREAVDYLLSVQAALKIETASKPPRCR